MIDLTGILAITGKPGLYKVLGQMRAGVLVERIEDGKKLPVPGTARMSALEDIAIYSYSEEISLKEVFFTIFEKEEGKETISHKSSADELKTFFRSVMENYDEDRVYVSDIKKVVSWYNCLQKAELLKVVEEENKEEAES
ncbi:MAG: DUF5606 domain-containing protein [Flavobacteriales bacterium]|jgi:hypothetical protein|nr:DUF5606 domain-containing protein [Flavobacteriales bacterium]